MENNYLSIAKNDYCFIMDCPRRGYNNNIAILCQQVCEKLLKHIIKETEPDSDLLQSHNLKKLYDTVRPYIVLSQDTRFYLSTLTDFYINAAYPGVDFMNVSDEDLGYCLSAMQEVYDKVIEWDRTRPSNKGVESLVRAASMFK